MGLTNIQYGNIQEHGAAKQRSREVRTAWVNWLEAGNFHFFLTLSTKVPGSAEKGWKSFSTFMKFLDGRISGRNGWKDASRRAFAVGVLEDIETHLHIHALLRFPDEVALPEAVTSEQHPKWKFIGERWRPVMETIWAKQHPQGDIKLLPFGRGAANYSLKRITEFPIYEHIMLSTDFHSTACKGRMRPIDC